MNVVFKFSIPISTTASERAEPNKANPKRNKKPDETKPRKQKILARTTNNENRRAEIPRKRTKLI